MDIQNIVAEVTKQVINSMSGSSDEAKSDITYNQSVGAGRNGLVVLCGIPQRFERAYSIISNMSAKGVTMDILFTSSASRLFDVNRMKAISGVKNVYLETDFFSVSQTVAAADFICVPLLSLPMAAKMSGFITDNRATCVMIEALGTGKPVFAETETINWFVSNPGCQPAFKTRASEIIEELRGLGVRFIPLDNMPSNMASYTPRLFPPAAPGSYQPLYRNRTAAIPAGPQNFSPAASGNYQPLYRNRTAPFSGMQQNLASSTPAIQQGFVPVTPVMPAGIPVPNISSSALAMPSSGSPVPATALDSSRQVAENCTYSDICPYPECIGCGMCIVQNSSSVNAILDAGAERIGAHKGILTPNQQIGAMIDHTLLKPDATAEEVRELCLEAKDHVFASVCVNPSHVELSARLLAGSPVKVCTVIGFPLGSTTTGTKAFETREAIMKGADEIDMVINVGALKAGNYALVEEDIRSVKAACGDKLLKVILETALLTDEEKVKGCTLAKTAGANYVKTSTGFGPGGATVQDVKLMRKTVGPYMGVKASGGVRDFQTAEAMVQAGATRIGASASVKIVTSGEAAVGTGY